MYEKFKPNQLTTHAKEQHLYSELPATINQYLTRQNPLRPKTSFAREPELEGSLTCMSLGM